MASRSNRFIGFVPAATTLPMQSHQHRPLKSQTLLLQANDWEILFDLGRTIAVSTWSGTCISATRCCNTFTVNQNSHHAGVDGPPGRPIPSGSWPKVIKVFSTCDCLSGKWLQGTPFPIEVGCLGYSPHSLLHCLEAFGLPKSTARQLRPEWSRVTWRCSYTSFSCTVASSLGRRCHARLY